MNKLSDKAKMYARLYGQPPYGREIEGTAELFLQMAEKLTEYEDLEQQGKLPKLPCAVEDTVHVILPRDSHITKAQINKIEVKPTIYGKMCYFIEPVSYRGHLYRYFENDFGKTVFLTIEAAEAALKELEGKI